MKNKKILIAAAVLALAAVALFWAYRTFAPRPVAGSKTVTLTVIHGDGSTKALELRTDAEYLGEALAEQEGLVEGEDGPYGLFIKSVDGEAASDAEKTWWCITKGGDTVTTSADLTTIADGEQYELTLMNY